MEYGDLQKLKNDMGQVVAMIHKLADALNVLMTRVDFLENQSIMRGCGSTVDSSDKRICPGLVTL